MKIFWLFAFMSFLAVDLTAQVFSNSNLPIVVITTDGGATIPDQPKILATMKIIYNGPGVRNSLADMNNASSLNYNGRIGIEIRGSSTQALEKKQYSVETRLADGVTNNNVSLLGMPSENDWVLNGLGFEPSLVRDHISYALSNAMGQYAPRTRYCEVVINGDYRGLYMLQEKIKIDKNRVDLIELTKNDNSLPEVSGGYITKCDKVAGQDQPAWVTSSYIGTNDVAFIHEAPKPSVITSAQGAFIQDWFTKFSSQANVDNNSITSGIPSYIDIPSFVDFMLINEIAANVDAYQFSTFFHKDRRGKLRAGPAWDFNLTYGNDLFLWNLDRSKYSLWQFDNGDNIGAKFWRDLFQNPTYKCYMAKRWNELTQDGKPLSLSYIYNLIDASVTEITEAEVREQARWQSIGDFPSQIASLKNWLNARITWMTANLGSFSDCANVLTPPIVITKINYQPSVSTQFPDSNDQEFIEIVNNGDQAVDLTGFYFLGTGLVYRFTDGATLPSRSTIQIASKFNTFYQRYGHAPYDQYTRHLSNDGQRIALADAFGNVIDEVTYSSAAPWPNAAGNGSYLKLISPDLDNSIATNWVAVNEDVAASTITAIAGYEKVQTELYPNPAETEVKIKANSEISSIQIYNTLGQPVGFISVGAKSYTLDVSDYKGGVYLFTVATAEGVDHIKMLKK
jgi:hypothetical protein